MLEDFIYSFLTILGEEEKIKDLRIKDEILKDLIESDEDFNHIKLKYEEKEWIFPLPNYITSIQVKTVEVEKYCYNQLCQLRHIAQLEEHTADNCGVGGASPPVPTNFKIKFK